MLQKLLDNKDVKRFAELISKSDNIVMVCHVRPDGDAIGSTLGFCHLFRSLGKNAAVVTPDTPPKSLSFLPGFSDIVPYTRYKDYASRLIKEADCIVCCDFNKLSRLEDLSGEIENAGASKVMVDHHRDPDNFTSITFSYPEMSSASELAFRVMSAMGYYEVLPFEAATCICTGIITDTRNLSVNCHYIDLYAIVEALLSKGVNKEKIVKCALETKTLSSIRLNAYALYKKLHIYEKHKAALVSLTQKELTDFGYEKGDTEGLVNEALQVEGVVYAIFLREDADCIKVSTRSVNRFPVCKICEQYFDGGGHLQAAGGKFFGSMEDCITLVEKILPEFDKYLKSEQNDEDNKSLKDA